ncbi:MAG TPA: acylphosphatase [Solirubrobacteraceae bacterium]|nr:acylphosphatase [Solirubrobacteraceae bacterium]
MVDPGNRVRAEPIVRRRLVVHGRVQGVFFRDSTRERARREGVAGWARNCEDGTVEVVLEGPEPAVASVAAFCELGPPQASVRSVETRSEQPQGLSGFEIR